MKNLFLTFCVVLYASVACAEEVVLPTLSGQLFGTLEVPKNTTSSSVVLIIPGSGTTNRDGNIQGVPGKNNSLKYVAEALARNGVASLRFDKRFIGKSTAPGLREENLRFETYIDDVAAWIQYLKQRGGFSRLFVLGHSEGSLIGMVASQRGRVDGFISVSGPGRTGDIILLEQMSKQLPPDLMKETEKIVATLKAGDVANAPSPVLNPLFRESVQPYLISWFRYDPAKEIAKLNIPILVIQGTTDIHVTVNDSKLLHAAGKDSKLVVIEGMNHFLKTVPFDPQQQLDSLGDPSLPISEELVGAVLKFVHSSEKENAKHVSENHQR